MVNKLPELKGETKLYFCRNISKYYHNMKIRMDEDTFAKSGQGFSKYYHEVLLIIK